MTKDWVPYESAKALLIGHDPRLRNSTNIASFCFYMNYYLDDSGNIKKFPASVSDQRKYGLAKATIDHLSFATVSFFKLNEIYITNLCNDELESVHVGGVFISEENARIGIFHIHDILKNNPSITYVFPMSLQVNYWLQKLSFYSDDSNFLTMAEPRLVGINAKPPYYIPKKNGAFRLICGKIFKITGSKLKVIPLLHPKQYPLTGSIERDYLNCYIRLQNDFRKLNRND